MKKRNDALDTFTMNTSGEIVRDATKNPYPLTKKIGLVVLAFTESMVVAVFGWSAYTKQLQEAFDAVGYQMIIFAAFWGVKAIADNIKSVRGKE